MAVADVAEGHPADGFGAESRVTRIFKAKGVTGVLAEINLFEGAGAKRIYFTELLEDPA